MNRLKKELLILGMNKIVDWELVCSDLICEEYGEPECTDFILEDMQ